jgi:predicted nuclease of predicted toxin-antitoxin system
MKFLADENVEGLVVKALQEAGHDVATIAAEFAGIRDRDVLARSVQERRILLTNDKDFAELAFFKRAVATGIILIRLPRSSSRDKASRMDSRVDPGGHGEVPGPPQRRCRLPLRSSAASERRTACAVDAQRFARRVAGQPRPIAFLALTPG